MKKHKNGFTLAEVLITLVIIGIIAAMTIPTLMNKTNEQETVVAVKKVYSTLSQAYQRLVTDYGEIDVSYWGETYDEATKNFGDVFAKYLNTQKICGQEAGSDCWSTENGGMYKLFSGSNWQIWNSPPDNFYRMMLSDGTSLALYYDDLPVRGSSDVLQSIQVVCHVDVNGYKGPNTLGKDVFVFYLTKSAVVPAGTPYETVYPISKCRTVGTSCGAWVITKGNMDYLRKDISW